MESIASKLDAKSVRIAVAVALGGFVGFLAIPSVGHMAGLVVMFAGAAAVVVCAFGWMRTPPGSAGVGIVAIASALGLIASVVYLQSIADEPAAIPLAGMSGLLLSLIGLVVSFCCLRDSTPLSR